MKKYYYKAQSQVGPVSGVVEAISKKNARHRLLQQGELVTELKLMKRYSEKIFWNFIKVLYTLIDQDMALSEALNILASSKSGPISSISYLLNEELSEGVDFLVAVENLFSNVNTETISLLRVGYENADLGKSLSLIIAAKERKNAFLAELQKAITYPLFVFSVSIFVLIIIFDNVLPEFKTLIKEDTQSFLTNFILSFSGEGYATLLNLLWFSIVFLLLIVLLRSSDQSRFLLEKVLDTTPLLGQISRMRVKSIFLENISLALLLRSDLKMAIQFSVRATGNQYHRLALSKVKDEILEGSSVEEALKNTDLFNRMELLRIGLAEKSGTLPKTFENLLESNYQNQRKWLGLLTQLLGPVTIVLLGVIIFFVALTVVTPMMSLQQAVG